MKRISIILLLVVMALHAVALDVAVTAGGLKDKVSDKTISSLTVTGTMNATDFYFIADNLRQLTTLDLKGVRIVSCQLPSLRYMKSDFNKDELPIGALAGLVLTQVVLPDSLKSIGMGAMAGCDCLTDVALPQGLESIGDYAFAGCSALPTVVLPATVTTVGTGAFMRCTALESISVEPSSKLTALGDIALMDCPALRTVDLGTALTTVGERALAGTGLRSLDLTAHRELNSIGDWAMVLSPVEQVKMPERLAQLGTGAFLYDTQLVGIDMGRKLAKLSDYLLAGTSLTGKLTLPPVETVGDYALYNVSSLPEVELPATLTFMGDSAMAGMTGLEALACRATNVPDLGEGVWAGVNQSVIPLEIPASARFRYMEADQWREFIIRNYGVPGDVNGDGEVTVADINTLIDIILSGGQGFDADTMARADVNMDGEINVADINAVIDIVLS